MEDRGCGQMGLGGRWARGNLYPIPDRGTPTLTSHQGGILHSLIFYKAFLCVFLFAFTLID